MLSIQMKSIAFFKPDPNNPRKTADESGLDHLGDDMLARGVLVPLLARPNGIIIDGWRRYLAAERKGIKELPVIITDKPEMEIRGIQLATVFHKADLTGHEKWLACSELMCMNPGWQMKDLAEFLHVDPSTVTRLLSPSRCSPEWQQALKDGVAGVSDCYAASKMPENEQASLLRLKLSGASRDSIERVGRTKRNGSGPSVKLSRVKCLLASGVLIVVSGEGLSLDDLIESLGEAQRQAKKAREQNLDIRTFEAVLKDKSKKG